MIVNDSVSKLCQVNFVSANPDPVSDVQGNSRRQTVSKGALRLPATLANSSATLTGLRAPAECLLDQLLCINNNINIGCERFA